MSSSYRWTKSCFFTRPESRRCEVDLVDLGSPSQVKSFQFLIAAEFANKSHDFIEIFVIVQYIARKTYVDVFHRFVQ